MATSLSCESRTPAGTETMQLSLQMELRRCLRLSPIFQIKKHICYTQRIPITMIASSETSRFKELLRKSSKNFNGSACLSLLASIVFVMTDGPSISASIAVVSQIPTEDKNTFNVSACLSKHRGWIPISQPKKNMSHSKLSVSRSKHWIWASKSVF